MASLTTMASFVGGIAAVKRPWRSHRRSMVAAKAVTTAQSQDVVKQNRVANEEKGNNGRRAVMLAAAAAAISIVGSRQSPALAREQPKPGTPEAKKLYAPVCVTMPTARICHK